MMAIANRGGIFAAATTAALLLGGATASAEPKIGAAAPDFTAVDSNGRNHKLGEFRGKTVVLEWTNDKCPYVQKHYATGNMQKLQQDATGKGVVWLTVVSSAEGAPGAVDGAGANKLTADRKAAPTAVLLDPEGTVGKAYDARTTPHMFVIDSEGKLRYMGAIDDKPTTENADVAGARNYVAEAIADVAGGKEVAETITRPYGCSIKYKS